jgi:hypothetical protein
LEALALAVTVVAIVCPDIMKRLALQPKKKKHAAVDEESETW